MVDVLGSCLGWVEGKTSKFLPLAGGCGQKHASTLHPSRVHSQKQLLAIIPSGSVGLENRLSERGQGLGFFRDEGI